jgi:hypothetical protein
VNLKEAFFFIKENEGSSSLNKLVQLPMQLEEKLFFPVDHAFYYYGATYISIPNLILLL